VHQEFYISVTPVRQDDYLIRIEQVSPGVPLAEELVTWNVDEWLVEASQLMNDPLLGLLRGNVATLVGAESDLPEADLSPNLVAFGQKLYNALFQGQIRDSWVTAQGIAQNRRESLRLRLGLKGDHLQRLPWEVLHAGNRPIATGTDVIFSRYQSNFTPLANELQLHQTSGNDQTLRILMVLAAPTDQEVLQLEQEAENLKQELQADLRPSQPEQPPEMQLTILRQPGREQLTQALEHGQYHVLHYAGHSDLGAAGGDVYLVNDQTGLTEVLGGDDLAGLLVNNGISLAVFNSCRGVYAATTDSNTAAGAGNLADALLKRGIPAVLAMAERIPDDVARNLSQLFYRSLKQQNAVDLSLSRARQGLISSYSSNQLYWALPVLYLHPEFDGYLQLRPSENGNGRSPLDLRSDDEEFEFDLDLLTLPEEEPDASDRATVRSLYQELTSAPSGVMTAPTTGVNAATAASAAIAADLAKGQQCYAAGDYGGAIAAYANALEVEGLSSEQLAEVFNQLGMAFQADGKLAEATTAFKHALELDPRLAAAQHNWQQATRRAAAALATAAVTANAIAAAPSPTGPQTPAWQRPRVLIPAAIAALGLAGGGILWATTWSGNSIDQLLPKPSVTEVPSPLLPDASKTAKLTADATRRFASNDVAAGRKAVESLLDQQALAAARQILDGLPPAQLEQPDISFLRGRLAWQSARIKNRDFNVDDARRFWETTVKAKPEPLSYNMLGLALYTEGKLEQARAAWIKALELITANPKTPDTGSTAANPNPATPDLEAPMAYAGLALVAQKMAEPKSAQSHRLREEAVKLRNQALSAAPKHLQVKQLWLDWRWSEVAIKDWQRLLAVK
jgi:tetratricopeptide (TPR) repeat protein